MAKYDGLRDYLSQLKTDRWGASFKQLEHILQFRLPNSAYQHTAWWANQEGPGHSQCKAWRDAGWRVENLSLEKKLVSFRRLQRTATPAAPAEGTGPASDMPEAPKPQNRLSVPFGHSAKPAPAPARPLSPDAPYSTALPLQEPAAQNAAFPTNSPPAPPSYTDPLPKDLDPAHLVEALEAELRALKASQAQSRAQSLESRLPLPGGANPSGQTAKAPTPFAPPPSPAEVQLPILTVAPVQPSSPQAPAAPSAAAPAMSPAMSPAMAPAADKSPEAPTAPAYSLSLYEAKRAIARHYGLPESCIEITIKV